MKRCTSCLEEKPLDDFYLRSRVFVKKDGTRSVYRNSDCKACNVMQSAEYQRSNKEKVNARNKKWRDANKELANSAVRKWYSINKESKDSKTKEWKRNNRHRLTEAERRRQISKRNATPAWTDVEAMVDIYRTSEELTKRTKIKYHVDHVIPIVSKSVCGLHVPANLRVIPATENLRKSNKLEINI